MWRSACRDVTAAGKRAQTMAQRVSSGYKQLILPGVFAMLPSIDNLGSRGRCAVVNKGPTLLSGLHFVRCYTTFAESTDTCCLRPRHDRGTFETRALFYQLCFLGTSIPICCLPDQPQVLSRQIKPAIVQVHLVEDRVPAFQASQYAAGVGCRGIRNWCFGLERLGPRSLLSLVCDAE